MKRITKADIDQLAQRHGFEDFQDLSNNVKSCSDNSELAIDLMRLRGQLKEVMAQEPAALPQRNGLADVEVDATGLPHLNDLVLTVSRLIAKLLFGYTEDEIRFINDRALDIDAKHAHEAHHRARKAPGIGGHSHA
ncbi:hypothetical protein [Curvibacter delicatus]|uniref:hypothetical protein n=1 Tax=Curvibacter delicatus TaxID=80879 RepID=UPI000836C1FC|nr:hypothetical protein [Curvibacter delicatus]